MSQLISVIIPVYGVEKYIAKCIQSLLDQTFKNFEAIIVDDGSPDNSIAIAKSIVGDDTRFIFLEKENGGQASARNLGLDHATGDYIAFLDSDDYYSPNCLNECIKAFNLNPNIEIVMFGINSVSDDEQILKKFIPDINKYYSENDILLSKETINYSVWNKVYVAKIWKDKRFINGIIHEDKEILPSILYGKNLFLISECLYNYMLRPGSTTKSYNPLSLKSYLLIYKNYKEFLISKNVFSSYKEYYEYSYLRFCFYAELVHTIRYSKDYQQDLKKLKKQLDPKIINIRRAFRLFPLFSREFLAVILFKLCPQLLQRVYKTHSNVKKLCARD